MNAIVTSRMVVEMTDKVSDRTSRGDWIIPDVEDSCIWKAGILVFAIKLSPKYENP